MKISLICIGKTDDSYLVEGIETFQKRLKFYIGFKMIVIPDIKNSKNLSKEQQKAKEAEQILKLIGNSDYVVLLDERGREFRSVEFADFLSKKMVSSTQHLVFVIGGPYGFDASIEERSNGKISLSKMTLDRKSTRLNS